MQTTSIRPTYPRPYPRTLAAPAPRATRFEGIVLELLEQILAKLETLAHDIDDLDRGLRPYGDGTKARRRR